MICEDMWTDKIAKRLIKKTVDLFICINASPYDHEKQAQRYEVAKKITNISLLLAFVLVANCAQHSVKFGKKCTQVAKDGTYEKSFVWIVNNEINPDFDKKITKQNCISAES